MAGCLGDSDPAPLAFSLAEKKRLQHSCNSNSPRGSDSAREKNRKEVAALLSPGRGIEATLLAEATICNLTDSDSCDDDNNQSVTLMDISEICTGFAILGYSDSAFWTNVALYTTHLIQNLGGELMVGDTMMRGSAGSLGADGQLLTAAGDVLHLKDIRSVCFALCRVGRLDLYDAVMGALVSCGVIRRAIPPPIASR
jgi:hypothetical protein